MNPDSDNFPPQLAQRFLLFFLREDLAEEVLGDLEEKFYARMEEGSVFNAKLNYWYQVMHYLRPFAIRNFKSSTFNLNHYAMYKSYFKIGWRNLAKHKGYSFINIGGLAVGMMVAMLIGLWIYDELSFNQYHQNYDRLAWVMQNQMFDDGIQTWGWQAMQLGPELRTNYGAYFEHVITASFPQDRTLQIGEKALTRTGIFMEPTAPEMLSLRMLSGTPQGLVEPNSVLLTESTARAIFNNQDPIDKVLKLGEQEVKVTGVYEDLPNNSSFADVAFIAPWELHVKTLPDWLDWGNSWFQTIVQIADHAEMEQVSAAIKEVKMKHCDEGDAKFKPELFLQPLSKTYLYSEFEQGVNVGGRIQYVWLFGIVGAFVLLLACINFMNLSTARSEKRAREIGIRKAVGSLRSQLIHQFFTESVLIAGLAFVGALILVQLILQPFNEVADKEINMLWLSPTFWLFGVSFVLLTAVLAGSYPALYLSSLRAVSVLKGTFRAGRMATLPRRVLVVVQFTVSISLIVGTIVVFQQIQFVKNRPIGYNLNRLLTIPLKNDQINQRFETFRNELLQTGAVEEVAKSESSLTSTDVSNSGFDWKGKDPGMKDGFVTMRVSHEFGKTVDWEIVEGRDFSRDFVTDSVGFIINEAAAAYMGLDNPVGEQVKWGEGAVYTIIGVVNDMITHSPYDPVRQMIFFIDYKRSEVANVKLKPSVSIPEALAKIETVYQKHDPVNPFEYYFADEQYAEKFRAEERIGKLAGFFAILAIFISCLGLFGLASYVAEQRTKEIGIRKVLGASVGQLWQLLSKDFVLLVLISCLIAAPLAYYFLHGWLQNYEYRTDISWWIFVLAGLGALGITLLTVSFQTIKAALSNPVKSLRSE